MLFQQFPILFFGLDLTERLFSRIHFFGARDASFFEVEVMKERPILLGLVFVRDDEDDSAFAEFVERIIKDLPIFRIETRGWLVEEGNGLVLEHDSANPRALLFAAGTIFRVLVLNVSETEMLQRLVDAAFVRTDAREIVFQGSILGKGFRLERKRRYSGGGNRCAFRCLPMHNPFRRNKSIRCLGNRSSRSRKEASISRIPRRRG